MMGVESQDAMNVQNCGQGTNPPTALDWALQLYVRGFGIQYVRTHANWVWMNMSTRDGCGSPSWIGPIDRITTRTPRGSRGDCSKSSATGMKATRAEVPEDRLTSHAPVRDDFL